MIVPKDIDFKAERVPASSASPDTLIVPVDVAQGVIERPESRPVSEWLPEVIGLVLIYALIFGWFAWAAGV